MARKTAQRKNNKNTKTKNDSMSGRSGQHLISHKDVVMAYYLGGQGRGGIRQIQRDAEEKNVSLSANVLWNAYDVLSEAPNCNLEALESFIVKLHGERSTRKSRGKNPPQTGESRNYKAMTLKNKDGKKSDPFVRIPVSTLGIKGGAHLQADFEDGRIVLTLAE